MSFNQPAKAISINSANIRFRFTNPFLSEKSATQYLDSVNDYRREYLGRPTETYTNLINLAPGNCFF